MKSCHYCYLPILGTGIETTINNKEHFFCCSGCLFVFKLIGEENLEESEPLWILAKLSFAIFLSMNIMIFSIVLYSDYFNSLSLHLVIKIKYLLMFLATPIIFMLGLPLLKNTLVAKKNLNIGIELLIFISCFFAYLTSVYSTISNKGEIYFDTATMVLVFYTLGKLFESLAKVQAYKELKNYKKLTPDTAVKINNNNQETKTLVENLNFNDVIKVIPGEVVPVDCEILSGSGFFNESILTGEEKPVFKTGNNLVLAGSINYDGVFKLKVVRNLQQSFIANIKNLVENTLTDNSYYLNLANKISIYFIPLVLFLFSISFINQFYFSHKLFLSLNNSLSVLVVACPCALGIATPLVLFNTSLKLANQGIFIKDVNVLEKVTQLKKIFFDKTGTLTTSNLEAKISMLDNNIDYLYLLRLIGSLEQSSHHLIAKAINKKVKENNLQLFEVQNFKLFLGEGIYGEVNNHKIFIGNKIFMKNNGFNFKDNLKELNNNQLTSYIGWDNNLQATITLKENLREDTFSAINKLKALGLKTTILSGDKKDEVKNIAEKLKINEYYFSVTHQQKKEILLKERYASLVGDGINDALSLAVSYVGISFSSIVDINKHSAKVIITNNKLQSIPYLINISKMTVKLLKQNLFWAFFYNSFALIFAVAGFLKPIFAAFLMVLSSLFLIINSLRLLYYKNLD